MIYYVSITELSAWKSVLIWIVRNPMLPGSGGWVHFQGDRWHLWTACGLLVIGGSALCHASGAVSGVRKGRLSKAKILIIQWFSCRYTVYLLQDASGKIVVKLAPQLWSNISSDAHRLIRGLMESDPVKRLTITEYARTNYFSLWMNFRLVYC